MEEDLSQTGFVNGRHDTEPPPAVVPPPGVRYRGAMQPLKYLTGYPEHLQAQVRALIEQDRLGAILRDRYGQAHAVRNDRQLYDYAMAMKERFLRTSAPLNKVIYDNTLHVVKHALGTHTSVSRVQGSRLKASREIRVATVFRDAPAEFLKMIVVHELAHLKEGEHNKAFYQLCTHMAADYHQLEFDLRLYLTHLERTKPPHATAERLALKPRT